MHELLAEAEPQVKRVVTGNSETNDHMVAINEALGYQILGPTVRFWELPAAAPGALGAPGLGGFRGSGGCGGLGGSEGAGGSVVET
jgi:hypothetical protein